MKKCLECGGKNIIKRKLSNLDSFEFICNDCGLVQIDKKSYAESKNQEIFEEKFYEIIRNKHGQIKELLSINEEGEYILSLIDQIDDRWHGSFIVVSHKFKEFLKKYPTPKKFRPLLKGLFKFVKNEKN